MPDQPSCANEFDPKALTVEEAVEQGLGAVEAIDTAERVPVRDALDRVCGRPVSAPFDVPRHVNAAMDGYALSSADLPDEGSRRLEVVGTALAGHPFGGRLDSGQCVRIMTGAVVPQGADTVVMQEQVEAGEASIDVGHGHRQGENVRRPGEDLTRGTTVTEAGQRLGPADLGLLASLGIAEIDVLRRPVVAFFSTGDELRGVGQVLQQGEIYDSNRYTLGALLRRCHTQVMDMGTVPDDRLALRDALTRATETADVVLTSGGVSVGAADYVTDLLAELGSVEFWKIAMKPGRPLAFGRLGQALFFGLPGNPVSVMATFAILVRPVLERLAGYRGAGPLTLPARAAHPIKKRPGRKDYQRGILSRDGDGHAAVSTTGLQGSHVLSSMSRANCFIVLERDRADVEPGEQVDVMPFTELC